MSFYKFNFSSFTSSSSSSDEEDELIDNMVDYVIRYTISPLISAIQLSENPQKTSNTKRPFKRSFPTRGVFGFWFGLDTKSN